MNNDELINRNSIYDVLAIAYKHIMNNEGNAFIEYKSNVKYSKLVVPIIYSAGNTKNI